MIIPSVVFETGGTKRLIMHHPDATRPCDLGHNPEQRQIAFAYRKLSIARLEQTD